MVHAQSSSTPAVDRPSATIPDEAVEAAMATYCFAIDPCVECLAAGRCKAQQSRRSLIAMRAALEEVLGMAELFVPAPLNAPGFKRARAALEDGLRDTDLTRDLLEALQALEPHLDAIVCYASTMDEHEPNRLAVNARAAIAKATGEK